MPPRNNIERRSRRKKQTRLMFDPVSSPPATGSASTSVHSETKKPSPAKIRYHLPGSDLALNKKKKNGNATLKFPPTPAKSSQLGVDPLNGDSDDDDDDSDIVPQSSRRARNSSPPMTKPFNFGSSEDDTVPVISEPARKRGAMDGYNEVSDSSDGSEPEEPPVGSARKKQKIPAKKTIMIESDDESEPDLPKRKTPRSFIQGGSSYNAPIGSSKKSSGKQNSSSASKPSVRSRIQKSVTLSDSEDELALPVRVTRSRGSASKSIELPANQATSEEEEDDEDEDDIVSISPTKRRQGFIVIEDEVDKDDSESDESDIVLSPLKRCRQASVGDEGSSSGEESPTKRRRTNVVETPSRQTRQKKPKRRTAKEKTMELLKRKRAGEKIDELTASESEADGDGALYDTESDLQVLSEFEDEPEDEAPKSKKKGKSKGKSAAEEAEDDEDNWIVDDDEDTLGVPLGLHDIPLEFTHKSHKPLKEHFKDAVEWMIHNKVNPAFPRDDPIYRAAFRKLDDEVRGYASSKYVSSVWRDGFSKALWARPFFIERELERTGLENKCDACNRTNHPPKYIIQLQGKAYSKDTLEEIELDSDSESEDDSDSSEKSTGGKSVDSKGNILPDQDQEFLLGRFCASNARIAHSLIHWKHALNEWVLANLDGQGLLTPAKLAERDRMKAKARTKLAHSIVDDWEKDKTIKNLYGDFKRSLEAAREGKPERWGKH